MKSTLREHMVVSAAAQPVSADAARLHLPFLVGSQQFAIPYSEVARVTLPEGVAQIGRYPNLPACVVGVTSADSEMLTVVDAGLLLGSASTHRNMKTRLVVMADGPMKGFALLVTRVLDMTPLDTLVDSKDIRITGAEEFGLAMASIKRSHGAKT